MFAEAKEGNIRLIAVDIQEGMLLKGGGGGRRIWMPLVWISKAVVLHIEEEVISLSVLYLYLRFSVLLLWFQPIFMLFHLSYVAVWRPCCLLEFYPNRTLLLGFTVSFRQKSYGSVSINWHNLEIQAKELTSSSIPKDNLRKNWECNDHILFFSLSEELTCLDTKEPVGDWENDILW